ncbi:MAG: hypothetical protein A2Y93_02860 [Chloroflexi bacterium RBG_13_68_17]|nr:MAG: hypothetical protein A2Y93_02860 [Chloroflexi bacterium RBG_13_68_17]
MARKLIVLNGLAAILAVVHHSTHWVLTSMIWWADRYSAAAVPDLGQVGGPGYWLLRVVDQVADGAVFVFLFVAGYSVCMAVGAGQGTVGWRLIVARVKHLVLPYLVWSMVMLASGLLQGETWQPMEVIRILATGGAAAPYYFVPLLVQLYLLSPLLFPLAKSHGKRLLALAVAIQLVTIALVYGLLLGFGGGGFERFARVILDWHLPAYAPWFILGLIAGSHRLEFAAFLGKARRFLLWSIPPAFVAGLVEWESLRRVTGRSWLSPQETLVDILFFYLFLLALLAFEFVPPSTVPALSRIGAMAYGIYLSHVLVLEVTARVAYHIAPPLLAIPVLLQLTLVVFGAGIPFLVMTLLKRTAPGRLYAWAFG